VPDTTLEELLFGWRLPTKGSSQGAQAAGRAWESSKVLDAGEIAMSNGGNISAQQVTRVGTPAGLNSAEKSSLSNLDSLSSGQAGTVREHVSNSYFERNGFTSMDGKCGAGNCFDGVYIKGDQVIVNEVKPLNPDGSIKLSGGNNATGLKTQMTDDWIKSRADALIDTKDPVKMQTGYMIKDAIKSGNLTTVVSGVNSNGMVIVKVKP
jgi:filamentous hemagglutinin